MQMNNVQNIYAPGNLKYIEIKNCSQNGTRQSNFMSGIQNAHNILASLERSLRKSSRYEERVLRCKAAHAHSHAGSEWWADFSEEKISTCSKTGIEKSPKTQVNLTDSWSTMSIVCLQYQYEELSKRYESLLQAYDARCSSLNASDAKLAQFRQHVALTLANLAHAHKTLLSVGHKYFALRDRKLSQKKFYVEKLERLTRTVHDVMAAAERARLSLDAQLARSMAVEGDADTALLLAEIQKCNLLFLENMRLKAHIEEVAPGKVNWKTFY